MTTASPARRINVLLVGGGGREHALALALARSPRLGTLYTTHPGNPGIAALAVPVDVPVSIREIYRLQQFCDAKDIGLIVIGPEDPLAEGFADALAKRADGSVRPVFGPTRAAAQLEADKAFAKQVMRSASIPTGDARAFTDPDAARQYFESRALDDDAVSQVLGAASTIRDAGHRRAAVDALLRIGAAALRREPPIKADLTLIRDTRLVVAPVGDDKAIVLYAAAAAKAWRAQRHALPVIKAAGLAKGKGVIVPATLAEGVEAIEAIMRTRAFGDAGRTVLIEERLEGPEVSVLALCDGRNILVLPPCQDHKRLRDHDEGPNTGGMGAFCPAGTLDDAAMQIVERDILVPTVDALRREGIEYRGVLYAGLMLTPAGPKVLEFNARFGDPECQPLMARLRSDALTLMLACATGRLDEAEADFDPRPAVCVVLAAEGYPDKPRSGDAITGLDEAAKIPGVTITHAGTRREGDTILTAGGRVLGITALGDTMSEARDRAYAAADRIHFRGKQLRTDIAAGVAASA